eukprot:TRINITY_DN1024_c0_g1_i1.p1 TRINITY_DN1024_c0_g1~~TRINITY_DN1024_c0_g1_i1.p1  ORF type:complete len:306 (+),score=108.27 TRINITY_DN1024_c0_g1_i1:82-999(+)
MSKLWKFGLSTKSTSNRVTTTTTTTSTSTSNSNSNSNINLISKQTELLAFDNSSWALLSEELIFKCFWYLEIKDLSAITQTCCYFNRICVDHALWRYFCKKRWPYSSIYSPLENKWKQYYQHRTTIPWPIKIKVQPKSNIKIFRILLTGPRKSGKTSFLYHLKFGGNLFEPTSTQDYNYEIISKEDCLFYFMDVSDIETIDRWKYIFSSVDILIYFIDGSDREMLNNSTLKTQIEKLLNFPELEQAKFVTLVNKKETPRSASLGEIASKIDLFQLKRLKRTYFVQSISVLEAAGIEEVMRWITKD